MAGDLETVMQQALENTTARQNPTWAAWKAPEQNNKAAAINHRGPPPTNSIVAGPLSVQSACNARSPSTTSKMPRLYGTRYLTCFYCGRKNSTRYDARTRRFECPFCDATNYLDEVCSFLSSLIS